jgi:hypothetical protein
VVRQATSYDELYKEKCKLVWYSNGRLETDQLRRKLKKDGVTDEHGRIPANSAIRKWILDNGWHEWADIMDANAMTIVEEDLVLKKANMLREQAQRGFELQEMGMKALREEGFDSASAAVHAVIKGAELERTSKGIGEFILKMAKMTDTQLEEEIRKGLQNLADAGQTLDIEEGQEIKIDTESTTEE